MRILFVLEYYPPHIGGVETVFENLCAGLAQRGHNVTLVTSKLAGTKAVEVVNGVMIHRVRVPQKGSRYWFTFLSIPQVFKLAREVDVVHTTTYNGAFPAWLVSKLLGKKCVITVHEVLGSLWADLTDMGNVSAKLHQFLEKLIISLSFDKFACVSGYTSNSIKRLGVRHEKIKVIYNGVDQVLFDATGANASKIRRELNLKNEFIYMFYGRPGISKGVEYLIQAVPLISERVPHSKFLLILTHDPKERYESIKKMTNDLKVKDRVVLLDPVPRSELPDYIAASDCVVVPSLSEGFGFTAAEACAMGKPVVASNMASLPEVVSGRYILVEPRSPESIADGVNKVYKGEAEDTVKKVFAWSECIEKYLCLYQEMLNGVA